MKIRKSPFLAWGDFHARSRFARSTIPEEKWGTTRSLYLVLLFKIFSFISVLFSFNHYYYSHDQARLIFASLVFYHLSGAWHKLTTLILPG